MRLYSAPVRTLMAKLILLLAVLIMPFGMAPGQAVAFHHAAVAEMPAGHCPDQAPDQNRKGSFAECTMACAASLPAVDILLAEAVTIVCEPVLPAVTERLRGLHPDTETPPPKRS